MDAGAHNVLSDHTGKRCSVWVHLGLLRSFPEKKQKKPNKKTKMVASLVPTVGEIKKIIQSSSYSNKEKNSIKLL